jgi:hypothetical protein
MLALTVNQYNAVGTREALAKLACSNDSAYAAAKNENCLRIAH